MSKKKTYKPKSKNVSLLSVYLGISKNTDKNVSKNVKQTEQPKSRFYGNSSKY